MTDTKSLQKAFEDAEAHAQKIMADKDEALSKVRDRYADKLRDANNEAAEAQKAWLDAQVAQDLLDRPDGEALAASLGVDLSQYTDD
jgi:vacuolar-type H+-ATPase subunit E/Vma4